MEGFSTIGIEVDGSEESETVSSFVPISGSHTYAGFSNKSPLVPTHQLQTQSPHKSCGASDQTSAPLTANSAVLNNVPMHKTFSPGTKSYSQHFAEGMSRSPAKAPSGAAQRHLMDTHMGVDSTNIAFAGVGLAASSNGSAPIELNPVHLHDSFFEKLDQAASSHQVAELSAIIDSNSSPFHKWEAVRKLEQIYSKGVLAARKALIKAFNSDVMMVQSAAIQAVTANCSGGDSVERSLEVTMTLINLLDAPRPDSQESTNLKVLMLHGISKCGGQVDAYSVGVVMASCEDPSEEVRKASMKAAGKLCKPGDAHHIMRLLRAVEQDQVASVRAQAVSSLAEITKMDDERVVAVLVRSLTDREEAVRRSSLDAFAAYADGGKFGNTKVQGENSNLMALIRRSLAQPSDSEFLPETFKVLFALNRSERQ